MLRLNGSKILSKKNIILTILLLFITVPLGAQVYAMFQLNSVPQVPQIKGVFTATIKVHNVTDLYAWQVVILYDSKNTVVMDTIGGILEVDEVPFMLNYTDTEKGLLLVAYSLLGNVAGVKGSGILATVLFGYYSEDYRPPTLVSEAYGFETMLLNSTKGYIPIKDGTLEFQVSAEVKGNASPQ